MALDQYWEDEGSGEIVTSLGFQEYTAIEPALAVLEMKTGISIGMYSDSTLSPDHARILSRELSSKERLWRFEPIKQFDQMLCRAVRENRWIRLVGD